MTLAKHQIDLADDIINTIETGEEWESIEVHDPYIKQCTDVLYHVLDPLEDELGGERVEALKSAIFGYSNSVQRAAILYGMKVAATLHDVIHNPTAVTQRVADRVAERRKAT